MKLLFLVALFVKTSSSKPAEKYTTNKLFEGDLNEIQGSMMDIKSAAEDLETIETKLSDLAGKKDTIHQAELLLERAVDKTAYTNGWKGEGGSNDGGAGTRTLIYIFSYPVTTSVQI